MEGKVCTKCQEYKELSEYCKNGKGLRSRCKMCQNSIHKKWRDANSDIIRILNKTWRESNQEYLKSSKKEWYESNKTRISKEKASNRESINTANRERYAKKNKEEVSLKRKAYRDENKDYINQKERLYKKNNPLKFSEYRRRYDAKKRNEDPIFDFANKIRARVSGIFSRKGFTKRSKTGQILGCTFEHLYSHLILSAMNNYGLYLDCLEYEIDHIIPLAIAKTEEDVIRLNHYTNLQFLYPGDNGAKSDSLTWMDSFRRKREVLLNSLNGKMTITAEQAKDIRC